MGYEVNKRPILAKNGLEDLLGSTFTTGVTFSGNVTFAGDLSLPVEALTGSTATQTLTDHGVSFVTYGTSGKANNFIIPNPPSAGAVKYIFATNNTTSVELNFVLASTASVFFGTTFNDVQCSAASTGSPGGTPAGSMALALVARTSTQWAIFPGSTFNWDIVGSTGSTSQA